MGLASAPEHGIRIIVAALRHGPGSATCMAVTQNMAGRRHFLVTVYPHASLPWPARISFARRGGPQARTRCRP